MKRIILAAAVVLTLVGCSHPPKSGEVTAKSYEPPYTYYVNQCMSIGKDPCGMQIPIPHQEPEHWVLEVRDDADPEHVGKVRIDRESWHQYTVGSHWPDAR